MTLTTAATSKSTADYDCRTAVHNLLPDNCLGVRQEQVRQCIKNEITSNTVVLWCKSWCTDCAKLKELFENMEKNSSCNIFVVYYLDKHPYGDLIARELFRMTGQQSVPSVFIASKHIGGYQDTMRLHENGTLVKLIEEDKDDRISRGEIGSRVNDTCSQTNTLILD
jgi:glutaredoxin 3